MSEIRNLLDIAAEYITYKDAADHNPDVISEDEAEAKLNEIATRFATALSKHPENP